MREKTVENKLIREVAKLGGWIVKMTCQGTRGMPDRIIFLPDGRIYLVECKRPKGTPENLQKWVHAKLGSLGTRVYLVNDDETLKQFIHAIQSA